MKVNTLSEQLKSRIKFFQLMESDTFIRKVGKRIYSKKRTYAWPERRLLVSHKYKFLYCPIYKIASSSMMRFMIIANDPHRMQSLLKLDRNEIRSYVLINFSLDSYCEKAIEELIDGNYFKFVFVRNPWARLVSTYSNYFVQFYAEGRVSEIAISAAKHCYGSDSFEQRVNEVSFRQLVEYVYATKDDENLDRHCMSQSAFMGDIEYDFIGRIESFEEDFNAIKKRLDFDEDLADLMPPKVNATSYSSEMSGRQNYHDFLPESLCNLKNGFPKYQEFYTPELARLVRERYREDVEKFKYEFE